MQLPALELQRRTLLVSVDLCQITLRKKSYGKNIVFMFYLEIQTPDDPNEGLSIPI